VQAYEKQNPCASRSLPLRGSGFYTAERRARNSNAVLSALLRYGVKYEAEGKDLKAAVEAMQFSQRSTLRTVA
jgi:hypothetical protein